VKRIIEISICLLLGVAIGWYFGYTRPVAKNQRKVLRELQDNKDAFHMSEHQDEFAAVAACGVFARLEGDDVEKVEKAKHTLATIIAIYYRAHRLDGNSNLIARIESYAVTNAVISNAIYGKLE
jgi:hypothetical protein